MNKLSIVRSHIYLKSEFLERNEAIQNFSDLVLPMISLQKRKCLTSDTARPHTLLPHHPTMDSFLSHIKSESLSYNLEKHEQRVLSSAPFKISMRFAHLHTEIVQRVVHGQRQMVDTRNLLYSKTLLRVYQTQTHLGSAHHSCELKRRQSKGSVKVWKKSNKNYLN